MHFSGGMGPARLEDAGGFTGQADAIFVPSNEAELRDLLNEATRSKIQVTLAGAGTGLTGGGIPIEGWSISLANFRRLEISRGEAIVGAGVPLKELQIAAARTGQFYAPDPTETSAALGGTIATNASGSRSFLYGDTRRHVLALKVAFMDGSVHQYGRGEPVDFNVPSVPAPQTTKHSAGFPLRPGMDWVDLFVGSEGVLAAVVEAKVRLLPIPSDLMAGVCFFSGELDALAAVETWRTIAGLRMIEYFDEGSLKLLSSLYPAMPRGAKAALLVEQPVTSDSGLDDWEERLLHSNALAADSWFAATDSGRERFRQFRHALPEAVNRIVRGRGFMKIGSDCAVPPHRNLETMAYYRERLEAEFPGEYVIFGHIGDAHVHVNVLPSTQTESENAKVLMTEFAKRAVALGGTVAAEHGLGKRKAHLLAIQFSPDQMQAMKAVKRRFDPHGLLGRGTLFGLSREELR